MNNGLTLQVNTNNNSNSNDDSYMNNNDSSGNNVYEKQFKSFYAILKEKVAQRKYRFVINQINQTNEEYNTIGVSHAYKLNVLKIKAICKLIKHKLNKYEATQFKQGSTSYRTKTRRTSTLTSLSSVQSQSKQISLDKWYKEIQIELTTLINNYTSNVFIVDTIVECYLKYIHIRVLHCEKLDAYINAFVYLSLANMLIDKYYWYLKTPNTILECVKIYLAITKYLIINYNFILAQRYVEKCIQLLNKEILIRNNFEHAVPLQTLKLNKTFMYLIIAYLYYGYIEEQLGCISIAIDAYALSRFIGRKFVIEKYLQFVQCVNCVYKRSMQYRNVIEYFVDEVEKSKVKRMKMKFKRMEQVNASIKMHNEIASNKNKKIEYVIANMDIPKIEGIDKNVIIRSKSSSNSHYKGKRNFSEVMLSSLRLIDTYMKEESKELVNSMDVVKIADLDYYEQQNIVKILNKIYTKEYKYKHKQRNIRKGSCNKDKENISACYNNIPEIEENAKPRNCKLLFNSNSNLLSTELSYRNANSTRNKHLINFYNNNNNNNSTNCVSSLNNFSTLLSPSSSSSIFKGNTNTLSINNTTKASNIKQLILTKQTSTLFQTSKSQQHQTNITNNNNNNISPYKIKTKRFISLSPSNKHRNIPRYLPSRKSFEYSSSYKLKQKYIDKLNIREINYHKNILRLKGKEHFIPNERELNADHEFRVLKHIVDLNYNHEKQNLLNLTFSDVKELKRRSTIQSSLFMSLSARSVNEYHKWNERLKQRNGVGGDNNKEVKINNEKVIGQINKKLKLIKEEIKENKDTKMKIKKENEIKSKCGFNNNMNDSDGINKWMNVLHKKHNHFNLNTFIRFSRNKSK